MKVFRVYVDNCDYDEFDGCIVVAESIEDVKSMMKHTTKYGHRTYIDDGVWFNDRQGQIKIAEVDLTRKGVILSSFNAG